MKSKSYKPPLAYHRGQQARQECLEVESCPETDAVKAGWWRAGWHDQDMAYGNSWTDNR